MQTNEQLLHDTGKLSIWLRLPVLLLGLLLVWMSADLASSQLFGHGLGLRLTQESGSPWLGSLAMLGLGLGFVSVWFLRNRIVLDAGGGEIVIHHWGLFGRSRRRIPLAGAKAIGLHCGQIRASIFWDIGIEFDDGRQEWLTRVYDGADDTARVFSDGTKLPVVNV